MGNASGSVPWNIVVLLTLLTLLPALLLSMTPFVRLLVVFHFLRQALGTQSTPSNSRQRPILVEGDPFTLGSLTFGSGVRLERLQSMRDPILQLRIDQETQQQGQLDAFVSSMKQIEVAFTASDNDIGTQISKFFSSLDQLATDPANLSLRQSLLTAAGNVATVFRTTSNNLSSQRQSLDLNVTEAVQQVNEITKQIAGLNTQIQSLQNLNENADQFIDQRDVQIAELASLIDVTPIQSSDGLSLTTSNGSLLVSGGQSFALDEQLDPSGVQHVFSLGTDITASLKSGQLAGLIAVRDQQIPTLQSELDSLAAGFSSAVNTAHRSGFDLNGDPGQDFFVPPPAGGVGAAALMGVEITDPSLIAASSDGSAGSNGNLAVISAVHDQAVVSGRTPSDAYGNLVFEVGSVIANSSAELNASQLAVRQLQDQRGSISGVSLDEEAANLIQFQRAYEAAARVVATINDILDTTINLGRY
jgi:flagellar hook-associated protein 1 FlgK